MSSAELLRLTTLRQKMNAENDAIRREADALKEERVRLGIFKGKRKKEIDALLEQVPARIRAAEEKYEREKNNR